MIEVINKKDLVLEKSGLVDNFGVLKYKEVSPELISTLNFEGFTGFNAHYVRPLLELFAKNTATNSILKSFLINGNLHNDNTNHTANYYIIKNCRDTAFLFKTLKTFSITLPDLRIGYECKTHPHDVLYLDKKILRILMSLPEASKQELLYYFYCLAKLLYAINAVNLKLTYTNNVTVTAHDDQMNRVYAMYNTTPDSFKLECISLKEDVVLKSIQYINNNNITCPKKVLPEVKCTSSTVYNIIKTGNLEQLCIINTITKEYYIINLLTGTVYTNNELKEFNVFEYTEWMPHLIANMYEINPTLPGYTLQYLPLSSLLCSKEKEVYIHNDAQNFEALLECYPTISENTNMDLYKDYFKGSTLKFEGGVLNLRDQYDKDPYAQNLYKQVQAYYDDFDLKDLSGIIKGVAKGDIFSMLFEGESGTGKSTAARVIASRCGIPFIAINCSTNIEESDIFGAMIPNPEKKSADDPEFIWKDGPLTKAVRNGYFSVIEELGGARPGILMKFNSLLDESRQIDLPNGEIVKAHPNFRLIATTNIGYEGTNRLNKALINRFEICKKFEDLDEKELKAIIMKRLNYENTSKIDSILDVYRAIKKYSHEQNLGLVISIRQLLNLFKQGKYYKTAYDAVSNLLLNQAFLEEPEHLEHFKEIVLKAFPLNFKI